MTTPERDPSDLRDPALDAAWRRASDETPPPALDAAILAAAHRAVGSKPQGSAARAPWRWWSPLAAAAAIGAVAIGVLQLTPEERDATTATVSDTPRAEQRAAATADLPPLRPQPESAKNDVAAAPASSAPTVAEAKQRTVPSAPPAGSATSTTSSATPAAGKLERETPRLTEASRDPQAAAGRIRPDPFPAAKRELPASPAVPGRQAAMDAKSSPEPVAGASAEGSREVPASRADAAPALAASPPARAKDSASAAGAGLARNEPAQQPPADARRDNLATMRAAPMAAPPSVAGGRNKDEGEPKLAQRAAPAAMESAVLAKVQPGKARTPDDYIAMIRRLLAAGENEPATRELVAFRGAYADADARLPIELRAWAATVAR